MRTNASLVAVFFLACAGKESPPLDSTASSPVATSHPVFEIGLWPGEGIPVVEALRDNLPLRASPVVEAPVISELSTGIGSKITYDSTRFQTITPATIRVTRDAVVKGRSLGSLRYLSRDQYYSNAFRDTAVVLAPAAVLEFLQHRAEGTCFVRVGTIVIDARECPVLDTVRFTTIGQPQVRWWLFARGATGSGWLLLTDTTARTIDRRF
jgi:hypothetical protein